MSETMLETTIAGAFLITPAVHRDLRGSFVEVFNRASLLENQIDFYVAQDNMIVSRKGVLRGMHYQKQFPQSKLIRVVSGSIYDVIVDLREDSPTFQKCFEVVLNDKDNCALLAPKGVAHGFLSLTENTVVSYKVDDYYHPEDASGFRWNDPRYPIRWAPIDWNSCRDGEYCMNDGTRLILNPRDRKWE